MVHRRTATSSTCRFARGWWPHLPGFGAIASFVVDADRYLLATYNQENLKYVKSGLRGDGVRPVPGPDLQGEGEEIWQGSGQAVLPSGDLPDVHTPPPGNAPQGRFAVQLDMDGDGPVRFPIGAQGAAAIYRTARPSRLGGSGFGPYLAELAVPVEYLSFVGRCRSNSQVKMRGENPNPTFAVILRPRINSHAERAERMRVAFRTGVCGEVPCLPTQGHAGFSGTTSSSPPPTVTRGAACKGRPRQRGGPTRGRPSDDPITCWRRSLHPRRLIDNLQQPGAAEEISTSGGTMNGSVFNDDVIVIGSGFPLRHEKAVGGRLPQRGRSGQVLGEARCLLGWPVGRPVYLG